MQDVKCPSCSSYFELEDGYEIGDMVFCPDCNEELKITSLRPPKVMLEKSDDFSGDGDSEAEEY